MAKTNALKPTQTFDERRAQALSQCEHLTEDFAKRAERNKRRFKRLQAFSISLSICTTILSAVAASKKLEAIGIDWVVPAVSGVATLATTLLSQTTTQKMWVKSRNISQQFQRELFLYLQTSNEYKELADEEERLTYFSKKLMEIWSTAQDTWAQQTFSKK